MWVVSAAALCLLISLSLLSGRSNSGPEQSNGIRIQWTPDSPEVRTKTLDVSGLGPEALELLRTVKWDLSRWQRLLAVYAEPKDAAPGAELPPMLGQYSIESDRLRFVPQFPLESGIRYRAVYRPSQLPENAASESADVTSIFQLPDRISIPTTFVKAIYPSTDVVPENLLKFYIHFSASMSRGDIYDHIHLFDGQGREVRLPFLEIDEELWGSEMTRLTLFIDPGRIKRGVLPLEEVGPSLVEGGSYTLEIDHRWLDGNGNPLKEAYRKRFRVGPPDRRPPDQADWKIQTPKSGARDPLKVIFSEPMDHALAQRVIRVVDNTGSGLEGEVRLEENERKWIFTPTRAWRRGSYRLVILTTIEDLAGNNIGKPFEVDVFQGIDRHLTSDSVQLRFEIR